MAPAVWPPAIVPADAGLRRYVLRVPSKPNTPPPPPGTPIAAPTTTTRRCTRLAPSPTGALHLGNAMAFAAAWAIARAQSWRLVLRIEDLDGPRIKPGAAAHIERTLAWLGLDWDAPPLQQSHDLTPYARAMDQLAQRALVYPSTLSRHQLAAHESGASAPNAGTGEAPHPAALRPDRWQQPRAFALAPANAPPHTPPHTPAAEAAASEPSMSPTAWRFATPNRAVTFTDAIAGPQSHRPANIVGDFAVWTKQGVPAYQLAVVVDDARQGVTDVIRGNDLLDSAARQLMLISALHAPAADNANSATLRADAAPLNAADVHGAPRYWHLPLIVGHDGRRLAKRHGDTRIDTYRALGTTPERVIGLVAHWLGALERPRPLRAIELPALLANAWTLDQQPAAPTRVRQQPTITFTHQDHQWLTST